MNYKIIILFLLFCFKIQAQEKKDTISENKIEISSKTQTIYIIGGIVSTITKKDLAFSKKYNIQYHDFGCLAPINFEEYEIKNAIVFEKLNSEYGKHWQKEMKSSAMGFEKWKKK